MNVEILKPEVQKFLSLNAKRNSQKIALKKSPFDTVSSSELAMQVESRQKIEKKAPLWFHTPEIYYPPSLSIEQASSEDTALYKATLIDPSSSLIDLTGGMGIDSYYFSKKAERVVHCELNEDLSQIAEHNSKVLRAENIEFVQDDGLEFLRNQSKDVFQTIYLDPSRRVKSKKVFMLKDSEPNVVELQQEWFEKASTIMIKTAPLLDITLTIKELKNCKEVHVVSIKNECKEVLFILKRDFYGEPMIHAVGLGKEQNFEFSFLQSEEKQAIASYDLPQGYLYEPDVALLKAGCFKLLSSRFSIHKIHVNTHLYTSEERLEDFPGRSFEIKETYEYKDFKKIKRDWAANVISRNFPHSVEELRKRHKITESMLEYLFFCRAWDERLYVIYASRLT